MICRELTLFTVAQPKTTDTNEKQALSNAVYSLLLPGKILYLSVLLAQTKCKTCGKKAGALAGWRLLENSGLAKIMDMKAQRGTDKVNLYKFIKHTKTLMLYDWLYFHVHCLVYTSNPHCI